jgi:hypothetical protein
MTILACRCRILLCMGDAWKFNGSRMNESVLKPICQQVEQVFQMSHVRLCRYFAVIEDPYLAYWLQTYDGFQLPASNEWPKYLENERSSSDYLIYLTKATCVDPTGCAITYAHELQHVIQHGLYPKLLEINRALRCHLSDFKPMANEFDFPTEKDANIISKRVAELVCGVDAVRRFAENRVSSMRAAGAAAQEAKWELFLKTPSTTTYEPLAPTLEAVKEYEGRIDFKMDVKSSRWWLGPVLQPWTADG